MNYDVIFYTFRDIEDYLKNLSSFLRESYIIPNIVMNTKYENLIWKSCGGILLYFLTAQAAFTKILPFFSWKLKHKARQV